MSAPPIVGECEGDVIVRCRDVRGYWHALRLTTENAIDLAADLALVVDEINARETHA